MSSAEHKHTFESLPDTNTGGQSVATAKDDATITTTLITMAVPNVPKGMPSGKRTVYFSYNIYMSFEYINKYFPENVYIGCARLAGWKWFVNNIGEPNAHPSRNDFVYGSVYLLSESDAQNLVDGQFTRTTMTVDLLGPTGRQGLPALVFIDEKNVYDGMLGQGYIDSLNKGIADAFTSSYDYYVDKYMRPYVPEPATVPK